MKKCAIISCKAKKKDYKCSAQEMYSDSPQFKHQIGFINEYYDDYKILSLKYGIIDKETEIEPYNITLTKSGNMMSVNPTVSEQSRKNWATLVKKQISELSFKWGRIDLHLSDTYVTEVQEVLGIPNVNLVKLPNILQMKANYTKTLDVYKNKNNVDLDLVSSYVKWRNLYKNELLNKKMVLPWT